MAALLGLIALVPAASPVRGANGIWTNLAGGSWTNTPNWNADVMADGIGGIADFTTLGLSADTAVTLDGNRTNGSLLFGDTLGAHNWTLSAGATGTMTMAASSGAPMISVTNRTATIGFALAGTGGLSKVGGGTLVFTGTNTYTGSSYFTNGVVTFSGTGASSGNGALALGGAAGRCVLNLSSSGTVSFGNGSGMYWGGAGSASDTGVGVVNLSSGTFNVNLGANNLRLGGSGASTFGACSLSGGTLAISGTPQIGYGGGAVFTQTGGTLTSARYFGIGSAANAFGVVTLTGGTATFGTSGQAGWDISIGDAASGNGVLNIGTEAGGSVTATTLATNGLRLGSAASASGVLNLNSGSLQVAGAVRRGNATGNATVNFNGATLKAGGNNISLITNNLSAAYVYRGGAVFDSQTYTATNLATLQAALGKGIYPSGGAFAVSSGGSGYLAAPVVAVSGGTGSNATAVATVSSGSITSVVLTCPGQSYVAGDVLTFAFSGGGATSAAASFTHTLTESELADNAVGGLTKIGAGTLVMTAANNYKGNTSVLAGTVDVRADGGMGSGSVIVADGAALILGNGAANTYISSAANLVAGGSAVINLNYSGSCTIQALSLDGGATYVSPGTWGAPGSSASYQDSHFSGSGILTVQSQPTLTVVLTSGANPNFYRQSLTLTATVTGGGAVPSGTVTFMDGSTTLGSGSLDGTGKTSLTLSTLSLGTHLLTAVYGGNGSYPSGSSPTLSQLITLGVDVWTGAANALWDTNASVNWSIVGTPAVYLNGDNALFDDSASGSTAITLATAVTPASVVFSNISKAYSVTGSGGISGSGGMAKLGAGALTLNLANSYSGSTVVSNGTLTYTGASSSAGNGALLVGGGNGTAVLKVGSSGNFSFRGTTSVGGVVGNVSDLGSGAIYQNSGSVSLGSGNLELGTGGSGAYGYYEMNGGTMSMTSGSHIRVGALGRGVFRQSAGAVTCPGYFAVASMSGGNNTANSGAVGEATFTGGTFSISSGYSIILGDKPSSVAVVNLGSLAGGSAVLTAAQRDASGLGGIKFVADTGATGGTLNLNSGSLILSGAINRSTLSFGYSTLNLNGATLQAATNLNFIDAAVGSGSYGGNARVYNGGVVFDTQAFTTTNAVDLQAPGGSGIYPAGGQFAVSANGGAGYIGAPQVAVSGGSGSEATAIALVSGGTVTAVVMTCPGRNYQAGDVLSFDFAGGGTLTPASSFTHTLESSEVVPNTQGTLTKIGNGTLLLSGNNSYAGPTVVSAGKLSINTGSSGAGSYLVQNGAALTLSVLSENAQMAMSSLSLPGAAAALELDLTPIIATSWGAAPLNVTGELSLAGTVTLKLSIAGLSIGQYPLIQHGSLSGAGAFQLVNLPVGVQAHLVTNTSAFPNSIDVVVTSSGQPRWDGQVSGVWDIASTANWVDQLTSQPTTFNEAQPVLFDDNAGGTTSVSLSATVHPGSVTFNNNSRLYSLVGSGQIAGSTGLRKLGAGEAVIGNINTFTGPVVVGGGMLTVSNLADGGLGSAIGASSADSTNLVLCTNGTLRYAGTAVAAKRGYTVGTGGGTVSVDSSLTLSGAVAAVTNATFTKAGAGRLTYSGSTSNVLSDGGSTAAYGVAAGAVVLDGRAGGQWNQVYGELAVGLNGNGPATLLASNTTLAVAGELALDRGNSGNQSVVSLWNSSLSSATISLGRDNSGSSTWSVLDVRGSSVAANNTSLWVGQANGRGLVTLGETAALYSGTNGSGSLRLGGTGAAADTGAGALIQTGGSMTLGLDATGTMYFDLGAGGNSTYGYYELSGGSGLIGTNTIMRVGSGGVGVFRQSGGTFSTGRWFAVGSQASDSSVLNGTGEVTLTGGLLVVSNLQMVLSDKAGATGVMNLGTESGGTGVFRASSLNGIPMLGSPTSALAALNLNAGTLQLAGPVAQSNPGLALVNWNGATLQANANNILLLQSNLANVFLYRSGATVDTQTNTATIAAALNGATGSGLYPTGGVIAIPSSGAGGGYLSAPYVSVATSSGAGSNAMAIAIITNGMVTNVVITSPGQGYVAGDVVNFNFLGGAAASPAPTFAYTLTAADLSGNAGGGLVKQGAGMLNLSGTNTYTGVTLVANGTLSVLGALQGVGAVTVNSGARLSGNGSIAGSVTVNSGGTLAPGTNAIGALTVNGVLSLQSGATHYARLNKTAGACDAVRGLTQVQYAGTLTLTNLAGALAANDSFKLFDAAAYSGSFSAIVPATPGAGLVWDLSHLAVDGTVRVASGVDLTPISFTAVVSNGALNLSWPASHTGWRLQAQTNPISVGLSSNWYPWNVTDVTLTNAVAIPLNPANPSVFFRLVSP
jgi:autotransporter-associated beta strand protein